MCACICVCARVRARVCAHVCMHTCTCSLLLRRSLGAGWLHSFPPLLRRPCVHIWSLDVETSFMTHVLPAHAQNTGWVLPCALGLVASPQTAPPPPGALVWRWLSISEPQLPPVNNLAGRELQQLRKRVAGGEGPAPSPGPERQRRVCSHPRWPDANRGDMLRDAGSTHFTQPCKAASSSAVLLCGLLTHFVVLWG